MPVIGYYMYCFRSSTSPTAPRECLISVSLDSKSDNADTASCQVATPGQPVFCRAEQHGGVVSASDSRSGGRGFDSRPCHVAIALGKQFTLTFPSPPTFKNGYPATGFKCTGLLGH
ncbi:hypothetical protein ElyMa_005179600 [Elysia marginata]|uniref:CUB domain-containing protein n=1 Tax=Elysia marginata TaxID=1093978 RepID=A0AAV4JSJ4_9GAST|nr:hypothetical protein ElyMa_005179600 [Elysia marginata]